MFPPEETDYPTLLLDYASILFSREDRNYDERKFVFGKIKLWFSP